MAFRRITAYVVPLGVIIIAFVGLAALSTSGDTGPSAAVNTVDQAELPVRARVAAAVFAARFEAGFEEDAAVTTETRAAAPSTTTTAATANSPSTVTTKPRDSTPPAFEVVSPKDGAEVDTRVVRFQGTVEPGADVFTGRFYATVTDEGDWELPLTLLPGANVARLTASDAAGNETTIRLIVNYKPSETTTTTKAPRTTTTTKAPAKTTTTTKAPAKTTTTTKPPAPEWSPNWPADAGGARNVEAWRSDVEKHWPADRVDCVLGIIKKESRGDPRARNTAHDTRGLMQHLIKYWKGRATGAGFIDGNGLVATPYNGEANIAAGAYLADYHDRIGKNWWQPWGGLPSYGSCGS